MPPPGAHNPISNPPQRLSTQPLPPDSSPVYIPGPNDIVRAPVAGEHGPLAGINVDALKALLTSSNHHQKNPSVPTLPPPAALAPYQNSFSSDLGPQTTRHARRLYVGNLPPDTTEPQIEDFFNRALQASKGIETPGNAVISVYTNLEKRFAFIETRTVREAAAGLALDGVKFREMFLRLRRPNDFNPAIIPDPRPPPDFNPAVLGIVSTQVSDGPNKVFIGGIPYNLTEDQIKSLLTTYGPLAAFNLIKEPNTGLSKGFAFFEFLDGSVVDAACEGLHGMQVGDKTLTVRRATQTNTAATHASTVIPPDIAPDNPMPGAPVKLDSLVSCSTRVVELRDVVTTDELEDNTEYNEIREDMEEEGRKFGQLEELLIPRPTDQLPLRNGVGRIFLRYSTCAEAERAHDTMAGRRFGEQVVKAGFLHETKFENRDFL